MFLLFVRIILADDVPAKREPFGEPIVGFDFVGRTGDVLTQGQAGDPVEQKNRAHSTPDFLGCQKQPILPTLISQVAQEQCRGDLARLYGERNLHHIFPMGLDQIPIDGFGEQGIDMETGRWVGSERAGQSLHARNFM